MGDLAHPAGQRAAADYLRGLLLKPGQYRQVWEQRVERLRDGFINQLAVTEVLAAHLQSGRATRGGGDLLPYRLRETVADALSGRLVSREVLALFVAAFGFSEHESERLWRLWKGSATIRVLSGSQAVPTQAERELNDMIGPRRHQTISLHDHVWVGPDRRIDRARMLQVIEAAAPSVDRVPVITDTNVLTIEVGQGCKELIGPVRLTNAEAFLTEIVLPQTLDLGETITLEYWFTYRYPGDSADPHEREWRRAALRQLENYDVRLEFHPDQLPDRVWWARWEDTDGDVVEQQPVPLDSQHAVHRYLRSVSKTVAGFYWQWPDVES
jgi:hypothetical protein